MALSSLVILKCGMDLRPWMLSDPSTGNAGLDWAGLGCAGRRVFDPPEHLNGLFDLSDDHVGC